MLKFPPLSSMKVLPKTNLSSFCAPGFPLVNPNSLIIDFFLKKGLNKKIYVSSFF